MDFFSLHTAKSTKIIINSLKTLVNDYSYINNNIDQLVVIFYLLETSFFLRFQCNLRLFFFYAYRILKHTTNVNNELLNELNLKNLLNDQIKLNFCTRNYNVLGLIYIVLIFLRFKSCTRHVDIQAAMSVCNFVSYVKQ